MIVLWTYIPLATILLSLLLPYEATLSLMYNAVFPEPWFVILDIETQLVDIRFLLFPQLTFPSETMPVIPFVTLKTVDVEVSVDPIEEVIIVPIEPPALIFVISNELLILEIVILSFLFLSYILILSILEESSNTKVKDLGGGERVIVSELVGQSPLTFSESIVSIFPGVVILSIPKVLPIPEISTDFDLSEFSSLIEPITLYVVEVSAVSIFDMIISSIDSSVIVLI